MNAQNRCLGATSLPQIAACVSRRTRLLRRGTEALGVKIPEFQSSLAWLKPYPRKAFVKEVLSAKLVYEPENEADHYADNEARDKRKIKCAMLAAVAYVAR